MQQQHIGAHFSTDAIPMNNVTALATTSATPSFAEAQRRLAARRCDRAIAVATQQTTATGRGRDGPTSIRQRMGGVAMAAWGRVSGTTSNGPGAALSALSAPSFRVSQVDAELLDEELLTLLQSQVSEALRYVGSGRVADDWGAEVLLGLRAALFKLSVWDHDATYGAALQNLRYADARRTASPGVVVAPTRTQKTLYGLVTVGGRYAWTKWEDWLRDHDGADENMDEDDEDDETAGSLWTRLPLLARLPRLSTQTVQRLARATEWATDVYAAAAVVSFLVFLRHGRYRTLLDRVLRMRLVAPTSQVSREVSFEYLNRQLVWHAFTEFLLFLLPLVGVHRWRRWAARTWRRARGWASTSTGGSGGGGEPSKPAGELSFLPERTCAICYQDQNAATSEADVLAQAAASSGVVGSAETDVTNPYEAVPCGCVYCYVCVATRIEREEGDGWACLRCGAVVRSCRPWSGDVLEPAAAAAAAAAADKERQGTDDYDDRPSTASSAGSHHPHKSVGFADDVKVNEDEDDASSAAYDDEDSQDEVIVEEAAADSEHAEHAEHAWNESPDESV